MGGAMGGVMGGASTGAATEQAAGGINNPLNAKKPDRADFAPQEMDQDLRSRYLAIIDKYMVDKGMVDFIPRESRPYELRSPEERGQWRGASGNPVSQQATIKRPTLNDGLYFGGEIPKLPDPVAQSTSPQLPKPITEAPASSEPVVSSQMPTMGATAIKQGQAAPLTTNNAFFQEDNRRKQDEFNQVKDFVYRDRRK